MGKGWQIADKTLFCSRIFFAQKRKRIKTVQPPPPPPQLAPHYFSIRFTQKRRRRRGGNLNKRLQQACTHTACLGSSLQNKIGNTGIIPVNVYLYCKKLKLITAYCPTSEFNPPEYFNKKVFEWFVVEF